MKMIWLFMTMFLAHLQAATLAQQVSLKKDEAPLKEVLNEIRRQTGYLVLYRTAVLENAGPVSVELRQAPLDQALARILAGQNLDFSIEGKEIIIREAAKSPRNAAPYAGKLQSTVSGHITDTAGSPMPGVTVRVKGSETATSADLDGNFSIQASDDDILEFSLIGYLTVEVPLQGRSDITIVMREDNAELEEVVVVGYGTQKKTVVSAAVSTIDQETIRQTPGVSLQNMLTGKVAGFFTQQRSGRPGGDAAAMNIRGVATYHGNTSPLILVDDVEFNIGQFRAISPDEIESISILKDAEATAVYGVAGANGVILVTTKRGKAGKPVINLRMETGVQIPVRTFQTLGSYDAALLTNEALRNDGLEPLFSEESMELFRTGADPYGHPDVDWYSTIYRKAAPMSETNLNISGGTERVRYFLSMGYLSQGGLLNEIEYKGREPEPNSSPVNNQYYHRRYNFRSNLDIHPTSSLKVSLNLTGRYMETNQPTPGIFFQLFQYDFVRPYGYPVYNPDGSFGYPSPDLYQPRNRFNNPAALMALGGYTRDYNNFMNASLAAEQSLDKLLPGLSLKGMVTYSYANTANRRQTRNHIPSYYYNPDDGSYIPRDENIFRVGPYSLDYEGGKPNYRVNVQAHLNYNASFGEAHNVNALVLFNQTDFRDGAEIPQKGAGYTYRLGYNYKERYIFSATGAYNGSDRFVTQKRFNWFPAFGLAWNLHKEGFFERLLPVIDQFKIRGSWGMLGNVNVANLNQYYFEANYARSGGYAFGESPNSRTGIVEGDVGNDDVSWEEEEKKNVGVDLSLFDGKINISADYFDNYRTGILTQRQTIPLSFGIQTGNLPFLNLGKVKNSGYEVQLTYRGKTGQVGYSVNGQVTFADNEVIFRDDPPPLYPWQDRTGMPIGVNRQYIWTGQFYTQEEADDPNVAKPGGGTVKAGWLKYEDLNEDGIINQDDMAYTGRPNLPNTVLGLTLGASYKGFSFSVLFQSNMGSDVHLGFDAAVPFKTALQPVHLNRWTPETAETATFPALTYNFVGTYMNPNGNLSTFWTESGDYIRIRSAELGYTFPEAFYKKLKLSSLRAFVNAYNLWTWSKFFNKYQFDPEIVEELNQYEYPVTRMVNFGVSVGF